MRTDIRLAYKGKAWGTVRFEVAPAEGEAGYKNDRFRELIDLQLLRELVDDGGGGGVRT